MKKRKAEINEGNRGQSLVELALFLPIFLVIIAGVIEVSQLVITQNRITDAARSSSRFGVNGGQDDGMVSVIQSAITDTLGWDESKWDIWIIRGTLDDAGTSFEPDTWEFTHEFGYSNTVRSADLDIAFIQSEIIAELQLDHEGIDRDPVNGVDSASNLQIVGTYIIHDIESMMGFDSIPALASINSVSELNVMRLQATSGRQQNGCSAFPIAVSSGIRSATAPGTGGNPYPNNSEFDYPATPPSYDTFLYHSAEVDITNAQEGTLFKVSRGFSFESGNFGWLKWNLGISGINGSSLSGDAAVLANSLIWPGDSNNYADQGDPGTAAADGYGHTVRGYVKPGDATAQQLRQEEYVSASTAQLPDISSGVQSLIDSGTAIRVMLFETAYDSGSGLNISPNGDYYIDQFAIFRILGYGNSSADDEWLVLEFIRLDDSCGEPISSE